MTIANQVAVGTSVVRIWPPAGDTKQYGHANVPVNLIISRIDTQTSNVAIGGPNVVATGGTASVANNGVFLRGTTSTTLPDRLVLQVVNEEVYAIASAANVVLQVLAVNAS